MHNDFTTPESVRDLPTLGAMLATRAADQPDREFARFDDGTVWTWADAMDLARGAARMLQTEGVGFGDRVAVFLENGPEFIQVWFGACLIGAVIAPLNPSYKGAMLEGTLTTADAKVLVTSDDRVALVQRLATTPAMLLATQFRGVRATSIDVERSPEPWDAHAIIFTSGTTGLSKASVNTWAHCFTAGSWMIDGVGLTADDVFLVDLPLFHLSAITPVVLTVAQGGRIVVQKTPVMTGYWRNAKKIGATAGYCVGTMAQFFAAQPEDESDRDHQVRFMLASPLPADPAGFIARFGLQGLATAYGSSESSVSIRQPLGIELRPGSCGTLRPEFDLRLVDENDFPVAEGEVGEAIVRCTSPWLMMMGYLGNPEATHAAWRNGWFHTGDALRRDADGYYYFHDRYKDAVRRRGENISSFEVEREVIAYPGIADVACVPYPADVGGDDEVKVFYVVEPGAQINLEAVVEFLVEQMPHYMVPRYFEPIDELPRTATQRVQKFQLRQKGNSERTWDREAAGMVVSRKGLVRG
jgi:carnitine-CoA ligase